MSDADNLETPDRTMVFAKELAAHAVRIIESLDELDCFQKQDIIVIANTMVELEIRQRMRADELARLKTR